MPTTSSIVSLREEKGKRKKGGKRVSPQHSFHAFARAFLHTRSPPSCGWGRKKRRRKEGEPSVLSARIASLAAGPRRSHHVRSALRAEGREGEGKKGGEGPLVLRSIKPIRARVCYTSQKERKKREKRRVIGDLPEALARGSLDLRLVATGAEGGGREGRKKEKRKGWRPAFAHPLRTGASRSGVPNAEEKKREGKLKFPRSSPDPI